MKNRARVTIRPRDLANILILHDAVAVKGLFYHPTLNEIRILTKRMLKVLETK